MMSKLIHWEPAREVISLRDAMDRLVDDAFTRPWGFGSALQVPAVDLIQTDEEVLVRAALPGIKPDEVQISVTGDVLSLRGEIKQEQEVDEQAYAMRELRYGAFERHLRLPVEVQADKARAEFENGILTIGLPKAEAVRPKTITVKAK